MVVLSHTFILLLHEPPIQVKPLLRALLKSGSNVVVHYDEKQSISIANDFMDLMDEYTKRLIFCKKRARVGWGEWSILQATLNALYEIETRNLNPDYVTLLSGSCVPTVNLDDFYAFLAQHSDHQFIESQNVTIAPWVKGGIEEERWQYKHFFNWRSQPYLFELSLMAQQKLLKPRKLPAEHVPHMGSQWWSLTWDCLKQFLRFNEKYQGFYETTLIPDELYIQTFVANTYPKDTIFPQSLTYSHFTNWAVPRVFYDDCIESFSELPHFFARKVCFSAKDLRDKYINNNRQLPSRPAVTHLESFGTLLKDVKESNRVIPVRTVTDYPHNSDEPPLKPLLVVVVPALSALVEVHQKLRLSGEFGNPYTGFLSHAHIACLPDSEQVRERLKEGDWNSLSDYLRGEDRPVVLVDSYCYQGPVSALLSLKTNTLIEYRSPEDQKVLANNPLKESPIKARQHVAKSVEEILSAASTHDYSAQLEVRDW
ncbi:beta-1,6-N-acetylglucosaminyltransferase [Vibrio sp. WXL210]|uniref:beta-1,6-N-acetylglucosaminyltransferase n=1 Tax=Vibrio sp. WXL210 TaxID=3450709 RepID=UPI003EC8794B